MPDLITQIETWSKDHYEASYAASCAIECGREWLEELEFETFADWLNFVDALDDRHTDINAY